MSVYFPQEKKEIIEDSKNQNLEKNYNINPLENTVEVDNKEIGKNFINLANKIIIGQYSDAPDYLKDNEYIKNGYLLNCHSIKLVLRSLFVCSNETVNIWSHLIGCLISITFIILTAIYVKRATFKELTQAEYQDLKIKINQTITPWRTELNQFKLLENKSIDSNVVYLIDNITTNVENLSSNYGSKNTINSIINNYLDKIQGLINKITKSFSKITIRDNNISEIFITKWEACVNKINLYIKKDEDIKGENIKKWPLYIMLSSSIVCLGFSACFHWFSIYNKKVFSILSRLDYAGITFLIPGSCYPPYFYFYYCEKCNYIFFYYIIF